MSTLARQTLVREYALSRCAAALLLCIAATLSASTAKAEFRVQPYLQNPAEDAMTVIWFGDDAAAGTIAVDGVGVFTSSPVLAEELAYHEYEVPLLPEGDPGAPYLHRIRIEGLQSGTSYDYRVTQGGVSFEAGFRTTPTADQAIRFLVYADSETEPESTGRTQRWAEPYGDVYRRYIADQTVGYAENIRVMKSRQPDLVAIAGDLVEAGGAQRDWDEFWRHNAGQLNDLAGWAPLLPAVGNHESMGLDGGWYDAEASRAALAKYRTYFETPDNGSSKQQHQDRYYRVDYGPITLITIDASNGLPDGSSQDTNFDLAGEGETDFFGQPGEAPDFNPGSAQYQWLEAQLADAKVNSRFTFVQFHHAPYSVGPHGFTTEYDGHSGVPARVLTPLFAQYGVDAVFSGHDEMYEHSIVDGVHFYDVGIGGDSLRGPYMGQDGLYYDETLMDNEFQVFLAHLDAPEVWDGNCLLSGGKHYGHLEVNVFADDDGLWQAELTPVYVFPQMDELGNIIGWERRVYDDVTVLTAGTLPEPSTAALLLGGLIAAVTVIVVRRRRSKRI